MFKKALPGLLLAGSMLVSPLNAYAATEVQFWHAFTGRLGELVAEQVSTLSIRVKASTRSSRRTRAIIRRR